MKWRAGRVAVTDLARFLLPNSCVSCGRGVEGDPDALVCGVCRVRLRPVGNGCERCAQPVPLVGLCRFCAAWTPALRSVRSAVWLNVEAREIAHHLKYDDYPALAGFVAGCIARAVPRPDGGLLVPIPLGRKRLRTRGYNQAAAVARALAVAWDLPIRETALSRVSDSPSQTSLTPEARLANVAGAFTARGRGRGGVIIVDDVLTTGATLHEAAKALAGAGWDPVTAVTFARAQPFELRVQHEPVSSR